MHNNNLEENLDIEQHGAIFKHRVFGQHFYRGLLFTGIASESLLHSLEEFYVREDDYIISGYPKSGTTWVEEIAYLVLNNGVSSPMPCYFRCIHIEDERSFQMMLDMPSPRLLKTHLPFSMLPRQVLEKRPKIIHVMRNPKDLVVSYYHFYRSLSDLGNYTGSWEEFLEMFLAGYVCSGRWIDHTKGWWDQLGSNNILYLKYEDMQKDPKKGILKIAEFYEKRLSEEIVESIVKNTSFKSMKDNPATNFDNVDVIDQKISCFMRNGKVGDWKNYFTEAQSEKFDKLFNENLAQMGLHFDFVL